MSTVDKTKIDKDPNNEKLSPELIVVLKDLVKQYEEEDSWVRKQQVKFWKKNEEFWHGVQFIFWSETRQEWLSPADTKWFEQEEGREDASGPFYDFVINFYKAHGESLISALGAQIPSVRFPPDNADDADDITTSKVYDKIADLIARHNQAKILFLRALLVLFNQGVVAAYHAPKADKAFGNIQIPKYKTGMTCSNCGDKTISDNDDEEGPQEGSACEKCGGPLEIGTVIDGFQESPKTRVLIDVFGPLHVKLAVYARTQKDLPYIGLALDQPKAYLKYIFPHIADKVEQDYSEVGTTERLARTPSAYSSGTRVDENMNLATLKRWWFRPWVIDGLDDTKFKKEKKELKKKFPHGIYCAFVGSVYAESRDEDFDKYWTIGQAGLSTYIHSDALGAPLISPQEMGNVLTNLTMETIEQGIPSTFADTEVLNFDVYSKHEARPGQVYPCSAKPGQTISQGFYEGGRATLSKEVPEFADRLEKMMQFVSGSFPSLYGGPGEGKSRTFAEYNASRQQALQRLSIAWALSVYWWTALMDKCCHLYVENLVEDEHYTVPGPGKSDYANVWIRRSELTGHVGDVEPEGAETFPVSMAQKQGMFMKILEMNNEWLTAAWTDPSNRSVVADILGFPDFNIPGEDQKIKQSVEIQDMLKGMMCYPENEVDDDAIHIATCRTWCVGQLGMDAKRTNPQAYQMIYQHMMLHVQNQQQQLMQQMMLGQPPQGAPPQNG